MTPKATLSPAEVAAQIVGAGSCRLEDSNVGINVDHLDGGEIITLIREVAKLAGPKGLELRKVDAGRNVRDKIAEAGGDVRAPWTNERIVIAASDKPDHLKFDLQPKL